MDSTDVIMREDSASTPTTTTTTTTTTTNTLDIDPATFKSTLPPRKRAKTQEEKEQRKIERILRNRRAAHASREKKRKHVEYLENYVLKLEENLKKLNNNYNSVFDLLSNDQKSLVTPKFESLEDVTDLKEKIHANLNGSRKSNKKSKDLDDEEDLDDEQQQQQPQEEEEQQQPQPVSKKRKLESTINTPPPSLSSLSPMTTTTTNTSPSSPEITLKKENIHDDIMYITKHEHPQQQQPLDDVYNLKTEIEDTFWNYPSPISFHDSPLQLDMESSSTCPTTNHSIADLAAISLASRANRIVSVGL
ncbi:Transcriptional activator HAC1 [Candida tropicalis]